MLNKKQLLASEAQQIVRFEIITKVIPIIYQNAEPLINYAGCNTFGHKRIWSPDIWSPTIGPQLICSSGKTIPTNSVPNGLPKFGPHGQIVPNQFVLPWANGPYNILFVKGDRL